MTSRERVLTAINHVQPDRVPVDFGGTFETGIAASTMYHLKKALGLLGPGERVKVVECYQMIGEMTNDLREALHVDTIALYHPHSPFGFPNDDWKQWTLADGAEVLVPGKFVTEHSPDGCFYQYPKGDRTAKPSAVMPCDGFYFDSIIRQRPIDESTLDPNDNLEEFGSYPEHILRYLEIESRDLRGRSGKAVVYSFVGTSFGDVANTTAPELADPAGIRDTEEWYISFAARKDYIREVFEGQCEIGMANLARVRDAVGDRVDVIKITGADYGSQRGPLVSPDFYREMIKPLHTRICSWIHENTSWKVFMHTCGGIRPLLDDIIDAGIDIISPVQTSAEGMNPQSLKDEIGERITFWGGGVETQSTLPFGTPEDVYREVRDRIRVFNQGGGFVFNAVHNIQPQTPPENIIAMAEAIHDSW